MGIVKSILKMSQRNKMNIFGIILVVAAAIPIFRFLGIGMGYTYTTLSYYNAVNNLPNGSVLVFGWQAFKPGYIGSEDVYNAMFAQWHSKRFKVICLTLGPLASGYFEDIYRYKYRGKTLVEEFNLNYGKDYVITPFIPGEETALARFAADIQGTVSTDLYGTPISGLPIFQGLRTLNDVDVCYWATYSVTNDEQFIRQWGYAYKKPLIGSGNFWGISAWYPWPVVGYRDMIKGDAEFEALVGRPGRELARYESQSTYGAVLLSLFSAGLVYNLVRGKARRTVGEARAREEQ